jgi:hypothetical protein
VTPEGRIKNKIRKLLDSFEDGLYYYMVIPFGYGKTTVDYLICVDGLFVAIEAKGKPGQRPTPRQDDVLAEVRRAGGSTFVVNDDESLDALEQFLRGVMRWGR